MNQILTALRFVFLISLITFSFSFEKISAQSCNNWLSLPSHQSYVNIAEIDIAGTQLTVEATINRTVPYAPGVGDNNEGDIVSKHDNPTDVNYLLRPNHAYITTSNGFFGTPDVCPIELNKTYHVAMVYNGSFLRFYRNGILLSEVAATGNLFQNNWPTRIGLYPGTVISNFLGYVNEVRIWNVARTQAQIASYMNTGLPNPTTQAGLLAYYTFDNLLNKQGNPARNGTLAGSAIIGQTNSNCQLTPSNCNTLSEVTPNFVMPDTVCVNTPVSISNVSVNATSYYWNFCVGDINKTPTGTNIGNIGGLLTMPVFVDYVFANNNYYGFSINWNPGRLIRWDFGNSLLNVPTAVDLGNFGGIIPNYAEGIQVVQNQGRWYAIVVGGSAALGVTPRVLKVDFGANITNLAPVATSWGNLGNLAQPLDLHVFQENGNWYGFTVNGDNSTITRFNFTNSFNNVPTAVNLGNIGGLAYPTGIYAIKDNTVWRVFVTNGGNNSRANGAWSLTRLDFGTSLLNVPTGVNLGNPGGVLQHPRDLTILKSCGETIGFAVNGAFGSSDIIKINFQNNLAAVPTFTSLGNIANSSFPHSLSKIFRVGDDLYSFVTNVDNNTVTRLRFAGCTNSSIPNSALQNPPPITYDTPGTYNINLTIDDGLPTQASLCKQIVVVPGLVHKPTQDISICQGSSIKIGSSSATGSYLWNTGAATDSIVVNTAGIYWVETSSFGCVNRDSFAVTITPPLNVNLGIDTTICLPGNMVLNAGNPGSTYLWSNGSANQTLTVNAAGVYYVRVTRGGCVASDTIRVAAYNLSSFDFNYKQNVCDPLSVQFNGIGAALTNSYWDFGDGATLTGNINPIHQFPALGNYTVKYSTANGTCSDTLQKVISINITHDSLIITPDTIICAGSVKQLRTLPSLSFCWSPVTYLDNPNSPNPTTSAPQDITYYFTAEVTGTNLITNGNFSSGNTGFTSQYNFVNNNTTEGQYFVGANPQNWNGSLSACGDHTAGNGNMMLVNGTPIPDVNVWRQTVTVTPNTNYAFSTWIQALWAPNPAQLQFSINGKDVGQLITASLPTCTWTQFYTTWNSGNSTTAIISIVNRNTAIQGNDFALDDISFAPVFIRRDSVIIRVENPLVRTNADTTICPEGSVQLNTTGAQTYTWSPSAGLSNTGIANPVATPAALSQYIVTGTTMNGCIAKDTVVVNLFAKPTIVVSNDTTICRNDQVQLSSTGGVGYSWTPATTLNNPLISNPVASPTGNTKYYVTIIDTNTCQHLDSVLISLRPDAVFAVNTPAPVCRLDSVQLNASGGNIYSWQPANGLSNATIANPKAAPDLTTDYNVTITETTCNQSQTLVTRVTVMPLPAVNAVKSSDIDCRNAQTQLTASGASQYVWSPSTTLNNSSIFNPIATPATSTQYIVTGTGANGCSAKDTINVDVFGKPNIVVSDDVTICKNGQTQLNVNVAGSVTYNWSPAATLNNPSISNPVASPLVSTKYYVTITDAINCQYQDSVEVSVRPDAMFSINNPGQVCKDGSFQLNASGGDIYSWQPAGGLSNTGISNPIATPLVTTDYSVTIRENTCNQATTLTTTVTVLPVPTITATKSNDIDCSNDRSQLSATGAVQYLWAPATTLNNPALFNPVATPLATTDYIVEGTDASGCKGYDTISVKVDNVNKGGYLMPSAFTPNKDGLNDCYGIKYWGVIQELEFSIYNRWGQRIFFTKNAGQCWDGTYKGVEQDGGVYVYVIKAKTSCQPEVFRKGTFVLVR